MNRLSLIENCLSGVNSFKGSLLGEVFMSTPRDIHLTCPHYETTKFKVLDMVPRVMDSPRKDFHLRKITCRTLIPLRETILSEVFVSTQQGIHIAGLYYATNIPSSPWYQCYTKRFLESQTPVKTLKLTENYLREITSSKGSTLSEVFKPTP